MARIVADASVIVKFFIKEAYTEHALELRDSYIAGRIELLEPTLLPYEVLNAIKYNKAKRFGSEEFKIVIESLYGYEFNLKDIDGETASKAVDLAIRNNITIYDAVYVALAQSTHSELYTADGNLIKAIKLPYVKHIKDFR
ncbi:MAG: type II toxin-antitoxin system VapC family toxin [Candidatus Micrarchaeota archaeon]|nr:type II toxin-antitoxin system VapC family toxin [Candidatus Micrarchaeota archaeon]MDE1824129.1 type II toxin-antitoxin system VapC family toxin [Candidatus Micrarchaeota archaeon]MDE1849902.1 type II toxin-antitoxin system VapC family toxin [Candidatus Micrarchaeota archaeon]